MCTKRLYAFPIDFLIHINYISVSSFKLQAYAEVT